MPADIVNTTVTGQLISVNEFLHGSITGVLLVLFVAVIAAIIGIVVWKRYNN